MRTISIIFFLLFSCCGIGVLAQVAQFNIERASYSRHHLGIQLPALLNPVVPAAQFQYLYRTPSKTAIKFELGYLFSPLVLKDEMRRGFRAEFTYVRFEEEYRMWGITIGGRYALHNGNDVRTERFNSTLVNIVSRDNIDMRSRLGGVWYMMGGQFIHGDRWYSQLELLLGLIIYERRGLNVPAGERIFRGDSFWDFIQPNEFRARLLPSIRIYYSWGRRSKEVSNTIL